MTTSTFTTKLIRDPVELNAVAEAALACRISGERYDITQDPRWLVVQDAASSSSKGCFGVALYKEDELVAFTPILIDSWSLSCEVGYRAIARFPMQMASIKGRSFLARPGTELALLGAVEEACREYQVIHADGVPHDSSLFKALQGPMLAKGRWRYETNSNEHYVIDLPETHDEYMARHKGKFRHRLRSTARKFEKNYGTTRLHCVTAPNDLERFFEDVSAVSQQSWQGHVLGNAINEDSKTFIRACAEGGWLRGYVLYADDIPTAFIIGRQGGGTFYYDTIGFDPKWSAGSPGLVLLHLVVKELCEDGFKCFDFRHGASEYKRMFSSSSYFEGEVIWARKSVYTGIAFTSHWGVSTAVEQTKDVLERFDVLDRVRKTRKRLRSFLTSGKG